MVYYEITVIMVINKIKGTTNPLGVPVSARGIKPFQTLGYLKVTSSAVNTHFADMQHIFYYGPCSLALCTMTES